MLPRKKNTLCGDFDFGIYPFPIIDCKKDGSAVAVVLKKRSEVATAVLSAFFHGLNWICWRDLQQPFLEHLPSSLE